MAAPHIEVGENALPAFSVDVVPTMAPPVAVGAPLGLAAVGEHNGLRAPVPDQRLRRRAASGREPAHGGGAQVEYPQPEDGIEIRAEPPAGVDRLVLLVTRQPFVASRTTRAKP